MRKILLAATAGAALLTAPGLFASSADALTSLPSQNVVREAADSTNLNVQNVRWVCRWGYRGRHCWWEPNHRYWRY